MSRLSDPDGEAPFKRPSPRGPVLRKHRKKPLHPEEIARRLAASAKLSEAHPVEGWQWRYGWLLLLWDDREERHTRNLSPHVSYDEACQIRDKELETGGYERAWLIRKTGEREMR